MKKLYYMLLLAVMSLTVVSCDGWESPYYTDDIVGSWESYYGFDGYRDYDLWGYDVVRYDFYANYTGRYTYYSQTRLYFIDFQWETRGNRLYIWYADNDYDELYYGFENINGYANLVLSHSRHFYKYVVYRPAGFYYDKEKTLESGQEPVKE